MLKYLFARRQPSEKELGSDTTPLHRWNKNHLVQRTTEEFNQISTALIIIEVFSPSIENSGSLIQN